VVGNLRNYLTISVRPRLPTLVGGGELKKLLNN